MMPNTREKPIELISKWDVVNKLIQLENNYNFYKDVWDAQTLYRRICELEIGIGKTPPVAYNLSTTADKWIPVTERLPKNRGDYLVTKQLFGDSYVRVVSFAKDGRKISKYDFHNRWKNVWYEYHSEYGYITIDSVTHWMPLPEAPKGE